MDNVMDTTLVPVIVRVRACRKGLFAGQASFGRCRSKSEWVYGFKLALVVVDANGVITAFGLAPANSDERPIGEALIALDRHEAYLADKGFSSLMWERHCLEVRAAFWSPLHPRTIPVGCGGRRIGAGRQASGRS
jgi:hypothetical protein